MNGPAESWKLGSGEVVIDRDQSHVATHPSVLTLLPEALARIISSNREFIAEEVCFDRIVGETICVETGMGDEIVYAQRLNRMGLTRFVKNRAPVPCNTVTVCLEQAEREAGKYVLLTAYVGYRTPAEPWDTRWATDASVPFWSTHALVWGRELIVEGTETEVCPW